MTIFDTVFHEPAKSYSNRVVVRLTTSSWYTTRGVFMKKSLIYQKRLSQGFNILEDDCCMVGADETVPYIVNLGESEDGLYIVTVCNVKVDWETGTPDSWELKLVPYEEK